MAALLSKLAITFMVALAWWVAGGPVATGGPAAAATPVEAEPLRRRLAWTFGLALALRIAFLLLALAPAGDVREAAAFLAAIVAVALLWPLLALALAGPLTLQGRITRAVFTVIALVVLWGAGPSTSMFLFWIALTRCAWPPALKTTERFTASVGALVVGLALLLGVPRAPELSRAATAAEEFARFVRGLGIVFALYASTAAFKAFTNDPTLGIRRVSRRLVLSHVLVVTVPLVIVLALWVSSSYLGANADRALVAVRAVDREGARLEESLNLALEAPNPAAGARAFADRQLARWPRLRVYAVGESTITQLAGAPLPHDSLLTGWVKALDRLPGHGIVELANRRYLGAAAHRDRGGLVALEPADEAFDSTLSPLMGADVRMQSTGRGDDAGDSSFAARDGGEHGVRVTRGTRAPFLVAGRDSVSTAGGKFGFTGYALVQGVTRDFYSWKPERFLMSARASFRATLVGLFANVRENPVQVVPILALAGLALLLLPLANTNLKMVRGMGGSITRGIGALREGAEAFGAGKLAHRIPIAGDDDLWDTARQFNDMAGGLERARDLEKERDRLEHELDLARRIQARLLPSEPPRVAGLDVAGLSESAREVGGDYFDHVELGGGRLLLVIADVSGKGVPAALLMSGFRAALLGQDLASVPLDEVAARVNDFLHRSVEPGRFVTAFLAVIDGGSGRLTYVNAGHNPPLLLRSSGAIEALEEGGLILGIMQGSRFSCGDTVLAPGDLVALYTDGVTEGANAANEQWGEERLTALLKTVSSSPARDVAARIVRDVRAFEGASGPADDITVLVAKRGAVATG